MKRRVRVIEAGLLSTVQDRGRRNVAWLGVSGSGAVDWYSARAANRLVGNSDDAPLVETTLTGAVLAAECEARVAVTGASAAISVGRAGHETWRSYEVAPGDEIVVGPASRGLRSYIAIDGGIDVPLVLGSASTDLGAGMGGIDGRRLTSGDELPLGPRRTIPAAQRAFRASQIPAWSPAVTLATTDGPHVAQLGRAAVRQLRERAFRVSAASSRQAIRLEGEPVDVAGQTDVVTGGVCPGCVQIASDGMPVLLLAEHQSTGGYATALCVITAHLPRAAQLRPGEAVRFSRATYAEAADALDVSVRKLSRAYDVCAGAPLSAGFLEGLP